MELRIIFDKLRRCFKTNQIDSSKTQEKKPDQLRNIHLKAQGDTREHRDRLSSE